MSRRYLFALTASGGNVPPQLELARRLVRRGHAVHVLAPAVVREQIESAGATYEPYRATREHDESHPTTSAVRDFEARTPIGMVRAVRDRVLIGFARPMFDDATEVINRVGFDVVAPDFFLLGAMLAAEKAGIPCAPLVHTCYPFPAPGLPPFGSGLTPRDDRLGRLRDRVGQQMFMRLLLDPALPAINSIRSDMGLPLLTDPLAMYDRTERVLVLTSRSFDFPATLPVNVEYVGPQLPDANDETPWESPWPGRHKGHLVLVSLTTTYQAHEPVLARIIEAVRHLEAWTLVCTGGVKVDIARLPANVHLTKFAPHAQVIPQADLVITHAGHGTAIAALAHGVPLVCLPLGRDQPDVAARVVAHGAGMRLRPSSRPERIRRAAEHVLATPLYRVKAQALAGRIAAEHPETAGVAALELLAGRERSRTTA